MLVGAWSGRCALRNCCKVLGQVRPGSPLIRGAVPHPQIHFTTAFGRAAIPKLSKRHSKSAHSGAIPKHFVSLNSTCQYGTHSYIKFHPLRSLCLMQFANADREDKLAPLQLWRQISEHQGACNLLATVTELTMVRLASWHLHL